MKRRLLILFVIVAALTLVALALAQEPIYDYFVYLPLVLGGSGSIATLTATLIPTETLVPTPIPTNTPMHTPAPTVALPTSTTTPSPSTLPTPTPTYPPSPLCTPPWDPVDNDSIACESLP